MGYTRGITHLLTIDPNFQQDIQVPTGVLKNLTGGAHPLHICTPNCRHKTSHDTLCSIQQHFGLYPCLHLAWYALLPLQAAPHQTIRSGVVNRVVGCSSVKLCVGKDPVWYGLSSWQYWCNGNQKWGPRWEDIPHIFVDIPWPWCYSTVSGSSSGLYALLLRGIPSYTDPAWCTTLDKKYLKPPATLPKV